MPREGWSTITVREKDYKDIYKYYETNIDLLRRQGINNFNGFIVKLLYEQLEKYVEDGKLVLPE